MKPPSDSSTQNITLSLPKSLLRQVKVLAAERGTSVSSLLSTLLVDVVGKEDSYRKAMERIRHRLENPPDLGTGGEVTWTRDELHAR